jgi:ubiquinone/menaquinone biosynthesis C-methylase UbiE
MKPPTCVADQPSTPARNMGTLTTNHTSRAANNASRASDSRLIPDETVLDLGSGGGIDVLLSAKRVGRPARCTAST